MAQYPVPGTKSQALGPAPQRDPIEPRRIAVLFRYRQAFMQKQGRHLANSCEKFFG